MAGNMSIYMLNFPGNTFLDMDCESSGYYEGKLSGTVSISGYSEEYREHQLLKSPRLNITLESTSPPPAMAIEKIVDRIRLLQRQPTLDDNTALMEILGLSQYVHKSAGPRLYVDNSAGLPYCRLGGMPSLADRDKSRPSAWH
jgi:hypothetical protein